MRTRAHAAVPTPLRSRTRRAGTNGAQRRVATRSQGVDQSSVWALVIAMFPVGGMIGGLFGGGIADKVGRRTVLSLNNIVVIFGSVLMAAAPHVAVLIAGRFFIGVAAGVFSAVVPMYLAELAPIAIKGRIGSLNQLTNNLGPPSLETRAVRARASSSSSSS